MDENNNVNPNEVPEELDDLDNNIVVLTDENGVDTEFEFLDVIETEGKEYLVLLPIETADNGEVVIFRVVKDGEDETYVGVDSEEEASKIFNLFKEKAKDDYNFSE